VYTPEEREQLRTELLTLARADPRITGGAITGSATAGREDNYSDIDLAFGVRTPADVLAVLDDRSRWMRERCGAVDQLDLVVGAWVYRVFLLPSTLQVDIACVPQDQFGARAPTFKLVFGHATELPRPVSPNVHDLIGWAWLYGLHARSAIARGKRWQAEYMVSAVRDQVIALASVRLGLPSAHARSADALPPEVTTPLEKAIVRDLSIAELVRAMRVTIDALLDEIRIADPPLVERLENTLRELVTTATH
jgi:hypothetical protein